MPPVHPRGAVAALALALALGAVACSDTSAPTAPGGPAPAGPSTPPAQAIPLTIDPATGQVRVGRPAEETGAVGLAHSILGDEVVGLEATPCTLSPAKDKKLVRCTFDIRITNRLSRTELVTPTSFPRPPAGVDGLLVFPFLSGATGSPGGAATPTSDWDGEPVNFFNDVTGCSKNADDCYRWERFDAPLAPGTASEWRTVGFDIPKTAQAVSVYLVVAADLLDNPEHTVVLDPVPELTGEIAMPTGVVRQGDEMRAGLAMLGPGLFDDLRSVIAFDLSRIPATATIRAAILSLTVTSRHGPAEQGFVMIDLIDVGDELTTADHKGGTFGLVGGFGGPPGPNAHHIADRVASVHSAGFATAAFRLRWELDPAASPAELWYTVPRTSAGGGEVPRLTVTYGYD